MNKYQEAIKIFERYIDNEAYTEKMQNACKLAIKALEKATPKKRKIYAPLGLELCPTCGKDTYREFFKYCPYCGQALDWSEEE